LSAQQMAYYQARLVGVVWTTLFRDFRNNLTIYPDTNTPASHIVAYEYGSAFWVQPAQQILPAAYWNRTTTFAQNTYVQHGGLIYQAVQAGNGISGSFGPTGFGNNTARPTWQVGTGYALGARVTNGGNIYVCVIAGTSAAAGTGPAGTGTN